MQIPGNHRGSNSLTVIFFSVWTALLRRELPVLGRVLLLLGARQSRELPLLEAVAEIAHQPTPKVIPFDSTDQDPKTRDPCVNWTATPPVSSRNVTRLSGGEASACLPTTGSVDEAQQTYQLG